MRPNDLLILPLAAMWQQKLRTVLTTLGVVFGAFVLAASLSIGSGVQETIDRESHRVDISRRVEVFPKWDIGVTKTATDDTKVEGAMSDARRERIRASVAEMKGRMTLQQVRTELVPDNIKKIGELPHVKSLIPLAYNNGFAILGAKSEYGQIASARPGDESAERRLVAGRFFDAPDQRGVVLSEFLAYRLGLVDDADVEAAIGKPLRIEFRLQNLKPGFVVYLNNGKPRAEIHREEIAAMDKLAHRLPAALETLGLTKIEADTLRETLKGTPAVEIANYSEEFPIIGVLRKPYPEEQKDLWDPMRSDADMLMPYQTATDLYFRIPGDRGQGINEVVLMVDAEENVKGVVERVHKMGLEARAAIEFIERERLIYLMIFGAMTCVAGVALLVSALGIANTMLMSVLERTREIGIMKAVGADNRHLMFIFLVEGALIGLLGAIVGLLLAWAASFPGDAWVRSMVMRDIKIDLKGSIFVFPAWMACTVMGFTVLVTTLAALYPARHAARIEPVSALRHE